MRSRVSPKWISFVFLFLFLIFSLPVKARTESDYDRISTNASTPTDSSLGKPVLTKGRSIRDCIELKWKGVEGADGYYIYRRRPGDSQYERIQTISSPEARSAIIPCFESGRAYVYTLCAFRKKGSSVTISSYRRKGTIYIYLPPTEAPYAFDGEEGIKLSWKYVLGSGGYLIYRQEEGAPCKEKLATIKNGMTGTYLDTSAVPGKTYTYTLRSYFRYEGQNFYGIYDKKGVTITRQRIPASSKPVYRGLVIGEYIFDPDTYDPINQPEGSDNLYGTPTNVSAISTLLRDMNYSSVHVKTNVSKEEALNGIRQAFQGATASDVSFFYFNGHGMTARDETQSGSLIFTDLQNDCAVSYLTLKELSNALGKVPGKVIVLLESCGSGAAITTWEDALSDAPPLEASPGEFTSKALEAFQMADTITTAKFGDFLEEHKFYVMASSKAFTVSTEFNGIGALADGVCRSCGLNALGQIWEKNLPADKNGDGSITLEEAYLYTNHVIKGYNRISGQGQECIRYPVGSDQVLFIR